MRYTNARLPYLTLLDPKDLVLVLLARLLKCIRFRCIVLSVYIKK